MPTDPRDSDDVQKLAEELKALNYEELKERLRGVKDEDALGWVRYRFENDEKGRNPWQAIVINRWLERDKFFRNVLPQWIGTVAGILSFAVSILALVVALTDPPKAGSQQTGPPRVDTTESLPRQ